MAVHFSGHLGGGRNVDSLGFEKPEDLDEAAYAEFMSEYMPVLARRRKRWDKLAPSPNVAEFQLPKGVMAEKKLKRFVRKGIPSTFRPRLWMILSGAEEQQQNNPKEFINLCIKGPSDEVKHAVDLDLPRTFPDNMYFKDTPGNLKNDLYLVLTAFSNKNPSIGYCQGLNYIAGMCLLIVKEAEKAYWLLQVTASQFPDYYSHHMKGLKTDTLVLEHLLKSRCPELASKFEAVGVDLLLFTSKWFICWFLETLPMETVMRIWDCLFLEGPKIFFRAGLTLLIRNKYRFLKCANFHGMADLFNIVSIDPTAMACHSFLEDMFKIPGNLSKYEIDTLRQKLGPTVV